MTQSMTARVARMAVNDREHAIDFSGNVARNQVVDAEDHAMSVKASEPVYEVVSPIGLRPAVTSTTPDRIPDLSGKTIAFVWDYIFRGDEMFDLIKEELGKRYDGVQFVDYAAFGNIHGAHELDELAALPGRLAEHGVDAAVIGVAA
jgi:hypothetical protein